MGESGSESGVRVQMMLSLNKGIMVKNEQGSMTESPRTTSKPDSLTVTRTAPEGDGGKQSGWILFNVHFLLDLWRFFLLQTTSNDKSLSRPIYSTVLLCSSQPLSFLLNGCLITVMMSPTPTALPPPGLCVCVCVGKHSDYKALITADSLGKDKYTN